jgi:magnesium chelatase family protein
MLAKARTCAVVGLDGFIIDVEVDISPGLPAFNVVGLPDTAVQEARERVRAAIRNSDCEYPMRRITANLAPADLRKAGPSYDLPLAVALLCASGQVHGVPENSMFLGELSLNGDVRHTNGILPMVAVANEAGIETAFVPAEDGKEAALIEGIQVLPVQNLTELVEHLRGQRHLEPVLSDDSYLTGDHDFDGPGLESIRGQEHAKRAMEVAAAGGHNLLMNGPPGAGKTLLARAMPSILPPLSQQEALEVTKIYSVAGMLPQGSPLVTQRPFRAPHHTISNAGLVGGGRIPRPGEITLSHRGVLFLDELPEFGHTILEALRQPIEDQVVTISRAQGTITYPTNFMLLGAMNPCQCGFYGDLFQECTCTPTQVSRYSKRISGPMLDRIDLFVDVPRVDYEKLVAPSQSESSGAVRDRTSAASQRQRQRFSGTPILSNSEMGPTEVYEYCNLDESAESLVQTAMRQMHLSARAYHRILKVSRTISDLASSDTIGISHVAEALQYRPAQGL